MIVIGLGIAGIGRRWSCFLASGSPIGRLPGDIRLEGENDLPDPDGQHDLISPSLTIVVNVLLRRRSKPRTPPTSRLPPAAAHNRGAAVEPRRTPPG